MADWKDSLKVETTEDTYEKKYDANLEDDLKRIHQNTDRYIKKSLERELP